MNRRWYGVPPLGGCASPDRLKPELHAVRGFMVPMRAEKSRKGAFHEPTLVWSPAFRRLRVAKPAEAGTPSGQKFKVPMRAQKRKGAFHEPRWYGVPPLGGCASPDRLKPEFHAVGSSWSQCVRKSERGLSPKGRRHDENDQNPFPSWEGVRRGFDSNLNADRCVRVCSLNLRSEFAVEKFFSPQINARS